MNRLLTVFAAFVLASSTCYAHPNHIGVTEIEWNPTSGRFEVAMKLRVTDLEDAISVINKKRWRIETADDKEQQLKKYLKQHFSITLQNHKACRLHWVGSELLLHDVWIYFEAESLSEKSPSQDSEPSTTFDNFLANANRKGVAGQALVVCNTALMEIQPEQNHVVAVVEEGRRTTFVLNQKQSSAKFADSTAVAIHQTAIHQTP